MSEPGQEPGPRFNIKTVFPGYGDSHVKDKTIVRLSYLKHGDPYAGKTTFLYWDGTQIRINSGYGCHFFCTKHPDIRLWPGSKRQQAIICNNRYSDFIMGTIASQITSLTIVYSTVYSGADQREPQSSASLAFVQGIHRGLVNSRHKWPVTRKMSLMTSSWWWPKLHDIIASLGVSESFHWGQVMHICITNLGHH